ncbi:MAG: hypothetical protein UR94_C0015G0013 [Parcubacteria group bacterium GW2011_GWA2_36_10]|nr:MAG: hypothetical protein UR94_C0015G0013 [Parcubacteria group bacterium GW2011_GWA2_36_10]
MKIKEFFYLSPRMRGKQMAIFVLSLFLILPNISLAEPLFNPLNVATFPELVRSVITGILGVVGAVSLVMMVIGGITWMTSAGNPDRVRRGRDTLLWAILGLVVIFLSYAIISFVFSGLGVPAT